MAAKKRKQHDPAPGWAWLLLGLSIGLAVALVVYLKAGNLPFDGGLGAEVAATRAAEPVPMPVRQPPPSSQQDRSPDAAAAEKPESTPDAESDDFSFFSSLPFAEVELPENGAAAAIDRAADTTEYEIQAGSFRSFEDADQRKGMLAFRGIESTIRPAMVGDQRWHRIIIGPVSGRSTIDGIIRVLREQRIEYLPPRPIAD